MEKKTIQDLIKYVSDNYEELLKLSLKQLNKKFNDEGFEIKYCEGARYSDRVMQHFDTTCDWEYGLVFDKIELYYDYGCSCKSFMDKTTTKDLLDNILGDIKPHTCKVNEKDLENWTYIYFHS